MSSEIEKVVAEMRDAVQSGEPMKFRYLSEWADRLEAATPPSSATPGDAFQIGDRVIWQSSNGTEFPGRITAVNHRVTTYDAALDDGTGAADFAAGRFRREGTQPQERAGSDAGAFWRDAYERMAYQLYRKRGHDDMDAREKAQADIESREREYLATHPQPASDASGGLPTPHALDWPDEGVTFERRAIALWVAHGYDTGAEPLFTADQMRAYASRALAESRADLLQLQKFATAIIGDDEIGSLDGGDIQDFAETCGLLIPTEVEEACGEGCNCAGYGDFPMTCYRHSPALRRAHKAAAFVAAQQQEARNED